MTNCNICKKPCGSDFIKILMGTHKDKTGKVRRFYKKVCDKCSIWCKGCGRYRLPINSIAVTEWNGYCDDCMIQFVCVKIECELI